MEVAVIESDGGIRTCVEMFLKDEGHTVIGYREIPPTYDGIDVVIFGPNITVPETLKNTLSELHIPHIQLPYFVLDMDDIMEQISSFTRTEQRLIEDRTLL